MMRGAKQKERKHVASLPGARAALAAWLGGGDGKECASCADAGDPTITIAIQVTATWQ